MKYRRPKNHSRRRSGFTLVAVLITLGLAAMLFIVLAKSAAVQRRAAEACRLRIQAQWLAEAAVQRAAARLRAERDYRGEQWRVAAAELGGSDEAVIDIQVATDADRPGRRLVRVTADYPADPPRRCRQVKQVAVDLAM